MGSRAPHDDPSLLEDERLFSPRPRRRPPALSRHRSGARLGSTDVPLPYDSLEASPTMPSETGIADAKSERRRGLTRRCPRRSTRVDHADRGHDCRESASRSCSRGRAQLDVGPWNKAMAGRMITCASRRRPRLNAPPRDPQQIFHSHRPRRRGRLQNRLQEHGRIRATQVDSGGEPNNSQIFETSIKLRKNERHRHFSQSFN